MGIGELVLNVVFYALVVLAVVCAVAVCASRNIVRSAFSLLGVLVAVAGFYLVAFADFMMAIQVLVYIGGILVLLIFAIMLTHRIRDIHLSNDSTHGPGPFFAVLALAIALIFVVLDTNWIPYEDFKKNQFTEAGYDPAAYETSRGTVMVSPRTGDEPMAKEIGMDLMTEFLLPFESISVLLLAALVGAAFLARKEVRKDPR